MGKVLFLAECCPDQAVCPELSHPATWQPGQIAEFREPPWDAAKLLQPLTLLSIAGACQQQCC